jgi:hypothetical protein
MQLEGSIDVGHLCTGLVVALRGYETDKGDFHVLQLLVPDMAPQPPLPTRPPRSPPQYLVPGPRASTTSSVSLLTACTQAIVSGLHVTTSDPLPLQMLCDWLTGQFGSPQVASLHHTRDNARALRAPALTWCSHVDSGSHQDQELASRIVRVIVAGNSLGNTLDGAEMQSLKHHHQHMTGAGTRDVLGHMGLCRDM